MAASAAQKPSIEKFLDFYIDPNGVEYYQVKWTPTWERADSLNSFQDLIDKFWSFINNSSSANICNNTTILKGPPIEIPVNSHAQHDQPQEFTPKKQVINIQKKATPKTPNQIKKTSLKQQITPTQKVKAMTPTQHMSPKQHMSPNFLQSAQSFMINQQPNMFGLSPGGNPTVIIDSDDEDYKKPDVSSIQILDTKSDIKATPPWKVNIKNEEINNEPIISPVRCDSNSYILNSKRKLGMSETFGINPAKQVFGMITQEENAGFKNFECKEEGAPAKQLSSSDWKSYFETLENYVDGKRVSQSFKCKVCGSMIAQQSNCSRHFKKHVKDSSGSTDGIYH
ncbi:uncharacterized protein LOC100203305 isoform X1 [Hydra vulgaris]|uniref:uncharacterized protein LOC100203305 isoform X1 n=1 Tax=Hydra vulgaris TaxID=6087 RepID=UPI001F5E5C04|nr:uncharacterized protein LOC100203305 [Hydra vulgaris]